MDMIDTMTMIRYGVDSSDVCGRRSQRQNSMVQIGAECKELEQSVKGAKRTSANIREANIVD